MTSLLHSHSPFRIFAFSGIFTLLTILLVYYYLGLTAVFITLILIVIELTFSFDNAIINAKVLATMSSFWQRMFMTIGIVIAVFGMRFAFPIVIVMLTAGLSWNEVVGMALHEPAKYSHELEQAHGSIAAFGGMFLLTLCLHFLLDSNRTVLWLTTIERHLQKYGKWWQYGAVSLFILLVVTFLPINTHPLTTFVAGILGIATYLCIHSLTAYMSSKYEQIDQSVGRTVQKVGLAGFVSFLYLEILDASFSFDGVIGAFAITNNIILIAISLGVGAVWVRSLTLFMVRRKVLDAYRYLEHGAHYTIGALAFVLLAGLFYKIPEVVSGGVGIVIIALSIVSSIKARNKDPVSVASRLW
jgi:uncharacterized protein